ncbi:MAG: phosphotransferase family protein [Solirubrobacterales bacterium]
MSLLSTDVAAFEAAARERIAALLAAGLDAATLHALFAELESSALSAYEVSRRAARLLTLLPPEADPALAAIAAEAAPPIRNALIARLPPELQRRAYEGGAPEPAALAPTPSPRQTPTTPAATPEDWHTVLLLGGAHEVGRNARLLENRDIKPVRVADLAAFDELAGEQICGFVVYASWWRQFSTPQSLLAFVEGQLASSNLLYLKLDYSGLGDAAGDLTAFIESLDPEQRNRIAEAQDPQLTDADLVRLCAAADFLAVADRAAVGIEGIDHGDRRLLAAALASFAVAKQLPRFQSAEELSIRPITEGRSGARVLAVRSGAFRVLVIAKLDCLENLRDELLRARQTMPAAWTAAGEIRLYSLQGRGVLLQRLLDQLDRPEEGAPSLCERLRAAERWEVGRLGPEPQLADFCLAVDRLVEKLGQLNRPAAETESPTTGWMDARTLGVLAGRGVRWQIESEVGDFDPAEHLELAEQILASHSDNCIVHGDMHGGNLLLRDERTPDLIDFATAGSGHPCFDLVRISSAIAYEFLRLLEGEERQRAFFVRLHIDGADEADLRAEFPDLLAGIGSGVALRALTRCRSAALASLAGDPGEDHRQYLAMVYLVAAQSLTVADLQEGVVRSALAAVGPALAG